MLARGKFVAGNLKCVVVGVGAHVFRKHRAALECPGFDIMGACDVNVARGARLSKELCCPFYSDYRAMLRSAQADVAILLIPHPLHAAIAIECMQQGYHVLVEKPAAVDLRQLDEMIEAAADNGRLMAVCLQHRVRPEVIEARQIITSGRLGTVQRVSVTGVWPRFARYYQASPWRGTWAGEGGGAAINQGIHQLDVLCMLLGSPLRVAAWARRQLHGIETEDTVLGLLEWESGCLGTVEITTARAAHELTFDLVGTWGRLRITEGALSFDEYELDAGDYLRNGYDMEWPAGRSSNVALAPSVDGHRVLYENLRAAILHGAPLLATGSSARESLELANALILSSAKNRTVEMPLDPAEYRCLLEERGAVSTSEGLLRMTGLVEEKNERT
jgi:predicted dehydrogenase